MKGQLCHDFFGRQTQDQLSVNNGLVQSFTISPLSQMSESLFIIYNHTHDGDRDDEDEDKGHFKDDQMTHSDI